MSWLVHKNIIENSNKIEVTLNSGAITNLTSPNKLITEQLADSYVFENSNIGTVTINIQFISEQQSNCIAFLKNDGEISPSLITIYPSFGSSFNVSLPDPIVKNGYSIYILDQQYSFEELDIKFSCVDNLQKSIGALFIGTSFEISISPSATFSSKDTSITDRSNGGQSYSSDGIVYNSLRFETTALTTAQSHNGSNSIVSFNNENGTRKPVIAILYGADNGDSFLTYGKQEKPATLIQ